MNEINLGEIIVKTLENHGVEFIFGIPGVHTVELYRALSNSKIQHITARHEQGAGFMADGYARISGKPGVCFVITGPGVTNILTAMAQARSDSIPMLVFSGVNKLKPPLISRAPLHDLPNQEKLTKQVTIASYTINNINDTQSIINKAFAKMTLGKPGPVHIQIPVDVMTQTITQESYFYYKQKKLLTPKKSEILEAIKTINKSNNPCIILGGGARSAKATIKKFVEFLKAPTVSTVNARDLLGQHPLHIPASPSLASVRKLLKEADLVIALGTEMGQTDYDMYENGLFPTLNNLIRVDIDTDQLRQSHPGTKNIKGDVKVFCEEILKKVRSKENTKSKDRVTICTNSVQLEIPSDYDSCKLLISTIITHLPNAILAGDSTQPTYYGNLYCEITSRNRWFNSATGFGTLGYAPPASIGAKLANPDKPVVCIVGDGGLQFSIAELGTVIDENVAVLFLIWNNNEYKEIRTYMESKAIKPIGITPKPPNLQLTAKSYGIQFTRVRTVTDLSNALLKFSIEPVPLIIEINETTFSKSQK
ncbi:MAG: 5-guanidino-2-oxopentanoate decarboxylase [Paracoccaceae bacterium]|nr:5-guanidino-2-oxopentanoate decarboxylase [Paracoccaceae bacterium]